MTSPTDPQVPSAERREEVLALWSRHGDGASVSRPNGKMIIWTALDWNFWSFIAALDAQHDAQLLVELRAVDAYFQKCKTSDGAQSAERTRAEVSALKSEHERIMAECYQAVGMISESLGCQHDENYTRLLDMLAYGKTKDGKELLPFPVLPNLVARAEVEKMREAAANTIATMAFLDRHEAVRLIRNLPIESPSR